MRTTTVTNQWRNNCLDQHGMYCQRCVLSTYRSCRRVERLVGCPELAPGQDPFVGQLLVDAGMRKTHGEHVANVAERDKRWETPGRRTLAKHIAEEQARNDDLGLGELPFRNGGKVCDVGQDVQNGDANDRKRGRKLEGPLWVLQLAHHVVGVLPPLVAVHDLQESRGVCVCAASPVAVALFNRPEVVEIVGVGDPSIAGQSCKPREHDQEENEDLKYAECVCQSESPFREDGV